MSSHGAMRRAKYQERVARRKREDEEARLTIQQRAEREVREAEKRLEREAAERINVMPESVRTEVVRREVPYGRRPMSRFGLAAILALSALGPMPINAEEVKKP